MLHSSYIMCTCGLPDIYTLSPRGPQALGVYINQTTCAPGKAIEFVLQTTCIDIIYKNNENLEI